MIIDLSLRTILRRVRHRLREMGRCWPDLTKAQDLPLTQIERVAMCSMRALPLSQRAIEFLRRPRLAKGGT